MQDKSNCDICGSGKIVITGVRSDGDAKLGICEKCRFRIDDAIRDHVKKTKYHGPYVIRPVGNGEFVLISNGGGQVK